MFTFEVEDTFESQPQTTGNPVIDPETNLHAVDEFGMPVFEMVDRSADDRYRWRIRNDEGAVITESAMSFATAEEATAQGHELYDEATVQFPA